MAKKPKKTAGGKPAKEKIVRVDVKLPESIYKRVAENAAKLNHKPTAYIELLCMNDIAKSGTPIVPANG